MRTAKMFVTGSMAAVIVAIVACGGSSSHAPGGASDAGGDALASDAALDASAACVIDADLTTAAPPDAALNDAGASVGACFGCAKTTCGMDIASCNTDCACNQVFGCLFNCLGSVGGTLLVCLSECSPEGGLSITNLSPSESGLLVCAAKSCSAECAATGLFGGGGGGGKDSGGGGTMDANGATDSSGDDAQTDATGE